MCSIVHVINHSINSLRSSWYQLGTQSKKFKVSLSNSDSNNCADPSMLCNVVDIQVYDDWQWCSVRGDTSELTWLTHSVPAASRPLESSWSWYQFFDLKIMNGSVDLDCLRAGSWTPDHLCSQPWLDADVILFFLFNNQDLTKFKALVFSLATLTSEMTWTRFTTNRPWAEWWVKRR